MISRPVAPSMAARGGVFVTVQDTGGAFGLEPGTRGADLGVLAFQAGVSALIKTAKQEWPTASLAAIDIDRVPLRTVEVWLLGPALTVTWIHRFPRVPPRGPLRA